MYWTHHVAAAAKRIGVDPEALQAVIEVESSGDGFRDDGEVIRRFEPHHVSPQLRARIGLPSQFGWLDSYDIKPAERERLYRLALAYNPEETRDATSYGLGQIMGFNAELCGYDSAAQMEAAFSDLGEQVWAIAAFIEARGLAPALAARDWREVARIYNGPGQIDRYSRAMETAYRRIAGKASPVVLRVGSTGREVRRLQDALIELGYLAHDEADGAFGPVTLDAVKQLQRDKGLAVDGVVGARTWAVLDDMPDAQPSETEAAAKKAEQAGSWIAGVGAATAAITAAQDFVEPAMEVVRRVPDWALGGALLLAGAGALIFIGGWVIRERDRSAA